MQMLDFETAQCCSMFFKAVLVFFFLRCFSNSRGQNSPATKLHDCKLPFALLGIGAWWMNGWMNEIPYTTMQWNESQRSIGKHVLFVFGGDRVVFADGPDLDSWHTVPTVIGSLRQQPASHKVGPHWLLRSISTLSSNLCSYQPQLIVCLELSNNERTCSLHHRSMHCFYLAGSFMWTTSRCFNTQWKRMSWWFAKYLFCMH